MPSLTGFQFKQLHAAPLAAYPTQADLILLLDQYLARRLSAIVTRARFANLSQLVFELIDWSSRYGCTPDLIHAAALGRPNDPALAAFLQQHPQTLQSSLGVAEPGIAPPARTAFALVVAGVLSPSGPIADAAPDPAAQRAAFAQALAAALTTPPDIVEVTAFAQAPGGLRLVITVPKSQLLTLYAALRSDLLPGIRVQTIDFATADLTATGLLGACLEGVNLRRVDLSHAYLLGADLRGADLIGAILHRAILNAAILQGANLAGAHLYSANFKDADLQRAPRAGATLDWMSPGKCDT